MEPLEQDVAQVRFHRRDGADHRADDVAGENFVVRRGCEQLFDQRLGERARIGSVAGDELAPGIEDGGAVHLREDLDRLVGAWESGAA